MSSLPGTAMGEATPMSYHESDEVGTAKVPSSLVVDRTLLPALWSHQFDRQHDHGHIASRQSATDLRNSSSLASSCG